MGAAGGRRAKGQAAAAAHSAQAANLSSFSFLDLALAFLDLSRHRRAKSEQLVYGHAHSMVGYPEGTRHSVDSPALPLKTGLIRMAHQVLLPLRPPPSSSSVLLLLRPPLPSSSCKSAATGQ